jgi:hypothetical protein
MTQPDGTVVFAGKGRAMALLRAVAALLWLLLATLAVGLVAVASFPGRVTERVIPAAVALLLAAPLVMQLRTLHSRMRQMAANSLVLDGAGVRIRLGGPYRLSKGLPEVLDTHVPWSDLIEITQQRRTFMYRSLIPFEYPLEVYTIVTAGVSIPFTNECIPGAKRAARELAARLGRDIRRTTG